MAVPDFQSLMIPILQLTSDGREHIKSQYVDELARKLSLNLDERNELLPSGKQSVFDNRVAWAITHMAKAGLLDRTGRGRIRITERGRQALASGAPCIDKRYLLQFAEYQEFRSGRGQVLENESKIELDAERTPDELLETSYQQLRQALAQDLLDKIKRGSPTFFEGVVIDLLVAMGYGGSRKDAGQAVGKSRDDGIDGIIKEDKLGLDFVYVQAKRWDQPVGRPIVQAFAGSLEGQRARKGVFITTSKFSRDAGDYVTRIEKRIVLIDGEQLTQLMIDHGVGVADVVTYHVKRVDTDYFGEE